MLKHHGQFGAQALQLLGVFGAEFSLFIGDSLQSFTPQDDAPLVGFFKQIDTA
jgi:hypothetical protein